MSHTCALCGNEHLFLNESGLCDMCDQFIAVTSMDNSLDDEVVFKIEDIFQIVRSL